MSHKRVHARLRTTCWRGAAYPGHPAFTPAGATATPMAPPRSIALCKKPDARASSINAFTAASAVGRSFGTTIFCGTLNRSSGNSLVPGVAVEADAPSTQKPWLPCRRCRCPCRLAEPDERHDNAHHINDSADVD